MTSIKASIIDEHGSCGLIWIALGELKLTRFSEPENRRNGNQPENYFRVESLTLKCGKGHYLYVFAIVVRVIF